MKKAPVVLVFKTHLLILSDDWLTKSSKNAKVQNFYQCVNSSPLTLTFLSKVHYLNPATEFVWTKLKFIWMAPKQRLVKSRFGLKLQDFHRTDTNQKLSVSLENPGNECFHTFQVKRNPLREK